MRNVIILAVLMCLPGCAQQPVERQQPEDVLKNVEQLRKPTNDKLTVNQHIDAWFKIKENQVAEQPAEQKKQTCYKDIPAKKGNYKNLAECLAGAWELPPGAENDTDAILFRNLVNSYFIATFEKVDLGQLTEAQANFEYEQYKAKLYYEMQSKQDEARRIKAANYQSFYQNHSRFSPMFWSNTQTYRPNTFNCSSTRMGIYTNTHCE